MKLFFLLAAAMIFIASPALALRVTNLDTVPHIVEWSGRGAPERRLIPPNETEYFTGASQGFLALTDANNPAASYGKIHADGLLSGVIGNARSSEIPADPDNSYAIWPGGHLNVQSRIKATQGR